MTTDALFKHIELLQGNQPWGRFLDAGTGEASLRFVSYTHLTLPTKA